MLWRGSVPKRNKGSVETKLGEVNLLITLHQAFKKNKSLIALSLQTASHGTKSISLMKKLSGNK